MNDSEKIDRVIALVTEDAYLSSFIRGIPEAIVMPFAEERHKRYIAVSLGVSEESATRNIVASICRRVIEVLSKGDLLSEMDGLEITLGAPYLGRMRRIFRLGFHSYAMTRAAQLMPADIDLPEPAPGISCATFKQQLA